MLFSFYRAAFSFTAAARGGYLARAPRGVKGKNQIRSCSLRPADRHLGAARRNRCIRAIARHD
jgi:hypothetical protein